MAVDVEPLAGGHRAGVLHVVPLAARGDPALGRHSALGVEVVPGAVDLLPARGDGAVGVGVVPGAVVLHPAAVGHGAVCGVEVVASAVDGDQAGLHLAVCVEVVPGAVDELPGAGGQVAVGVGVVPGVLVLDPGVGLHSPLVVEGVQGVLDLLSAGRGGPVSAEVVPGAVDLGPVLLQLTLLVVVAVAVLGLPAGLRSLGRAAGVGGRCGAGGDTRLS